MSVRGERVSRGGGSDGEGETGCTADNEVNETRKTTKDRELVTSTWQHRRTYLQLMM